MHTIRLRINDKIFNHFLWLLQRFGKDEIEIINEDHEYQSVQEYLKEELQLLEEGKQEYLTPEELDKHLEQTINKHED